MEDQKTKPSDESVVHTPGPWMVDSYTLTIGGTVCEIRNERSYLVAYVHDSPDQKGNAKLIAAAPRMKTALERIIDWNRQYAKDKHGDAEVAESWACIKEARDALKVV